MNAHALTPPVTVEQALEQTRQATELATALDEARELLTRVMAIAPEELDPPIRKEPADYAAARQMERQELEQRYALARLTARLSIRKVHDLEGEIERLEYYLGKRGAPLEALEKDNRDLRREVAAWRGA
ncbi:hypothetical protein ACM26W_01125 [Halomonas sp. HK25]|uniref:hypothetical protein n=1 Tax=Halomonas sp. HK25 TaxID=3394321 RepID=UPI0039FDB3CC